MTRILIEFCGCVFVNMLLIVNFCNAINNLENKLKAVLPNDKNTVSRSFNKDSSRYNNHIQKLKQINGVKTHNIAVAEILRSNDALIYINNPVESDLPYAFLTQNQLKEDIMNKARQRHMEFETLRNPLKMFKFKPIKTVKLVKKVVTPASTIDIPPLNKKPTVTHAMIHTDVSNEAISEKSNSKEDDESNSSPEETEIIDASTTNSEDITVNYATTTIKSSSKEDDDNSNSSEATKITDTTVTYAITTNSTNVPTNKSSFKEDNESSSSSETTKITEGSITNSDDTTVSYATTTNSTIVLNNKEDRPISDATTIGSTVTPTETRDTTISPTSIEDAAVLYAPTTITAIMPTNADENSPITEASSTVTEVKTTAGSTIGTRRTRGRPYVFMGDMKN